MSGTCKQLIYSVPYYEHMSALHGYLDLLGEISQFALKFRIGLFAFYLLAVFAFYSNPVAALINVGRRLVAVNRN
jgi:hypothetical protein